MIIDLMAGINTATIIAMVILLSLYIALWFSFKKKNK